MKIEVSRKNVTVFYTMILFINLFFITVLFLDWQQQMRISNVTILLLWSKLDMKGEGNLASWYSSVLFLLTAMTAFLNLGYSPYQGLRKGLHKVGWTLTGCLLLLISADEIAQIHESIATIMQTARAPETRSQNLVGAGDWIPFLLPFIVGSVVILFSSIVHSFWQRKGLMLIALTGILCWIGAVLAEAVEGRFIHVTMNLQLEGLIEESLEIIGTTLFLIAFLEHYQWRQKMESNQWKHSEAKNLKVTQSDNKRVPYSEALQS